MSRLFLVLALLLCPALCERVTAQPTSAVCAGVTVRAWVTASRPSTPNDGTSGYNLTSGYCEVWQAATSQWLPTSSLPSPAIIPSITGPTIITATTVPTASTAKSTNQSVVTMDIGSTTTASSLNIGVENRFNFLGTTGTLTGGGHIVGELVSIAANFSGTTTIPVAYGHESGASLIGTGLTFTNYVGYGFHPTGNANVNTMIGWTDILAAGELTGTIGGIVTYNCNDWTSGGITSVARACLRNLDPNKTIATLGTITNSTSQEVGPAQGGFGYAASRYYFGVNANNNTLTGTGLIGGGNIANCAPTYIHNRATFTKIGTRITTGVAASHIQLALYAMANGAPSGAPLVSTASQNSVSTGDVEVTISVSLDAGNYLVCINSDAATGVQFYEEYGLSAWFGMSASTGGATTPGFGQTFGTWPASPPLTFVAFGDTVPQIWLRQ